MNLQFIEDRLKFMLVPGCLYYPHKIAKEGGRNEPELRILQNIVPRGCRAIDIGANRGYYSYALSKIAGVVEAFEPNPLMARFARRKLGRTVRIHEAALSNNRGMMTLHIPKKGLTSMHLNGSLKKPYDYQAYSEQSVRVLKLDDFSFDNVGFVKIDTDGSEMEVLEGGVQTISQHRPNLVVELVAGTYVDPSACIERITREYGYEGWIIVGDRLVNALPALRARDPEMKTYNVIFKARPGSACPRQ